MIWGWETVVAKFNVVSPNLTRGVKKTNGNRNGAVNLSAEG